MSSEFISRIFGMFFFMIGGARLGVQNVDIFTNFPPDVTVFLFTLVGILFGLIVTPYITVRPIRTVRRLLTGISVDVLLIAMLGLTIGLVLALVAAYPISLLGEPLGNLIPTIMALVFGYLGMSIFGYRAKEVIEVFTPARNRSYNAGAGRELLLDTSVLIDGRIVEVAQTGFVGGTLIVPRFVLSEMHQISDSSDALRRARGRRGLAKLNELQRDPTIELQIIDDDVPTLNTVDDKLVALAIQRDSIVVTNDYNLNQVAEAQGVVVLNINELANAVKAIYIPGETFAVHIIQEGRENGQGVGYLEDGTMVVTENGSRYMDRTIKVEVTKLIQTQAGRMIFTKPSETNRR